MISVLRRWRIGLLGIAVSALAVFFIVSEIDFDLLGEALDAARWIYVLPCVLLLLAGLVTRGLRWRLLLSGALPLRRAFHMMNVAYLVNGVLPLRIGEVARIFLAARADPPVPVLKTASTIIVERLLDLLAVVMLVALALAAGPVLQQLRSAGIVMGVAGFAGFLVMVVLSRRRLTAHRLLSTLTGRVRLLDRFDLERLLDHFLDGLLPLATTRTLFGALFWTALSWGLSVAAGYVLMYTFYDEASLSATALYIAAAAFAIAVPATVGSLGVYELSIVIALEAVGYGEPYATAVAFAVTVHFVNVMVHAATGIVGFVAEGVTLEQLSAGVRRVRTPAEPGAPNEPLDTAASAPEFRVE
ncbi:MAG: lysylphosphatidylglycerol synthase transmembrane domain-containing protein [Chloroflexota bacterium]